MKLKDCLKLVSLLPLVTQAVVAQREVFAHFMVGLTAEYTPDHWHQDITAAQAARIDGFALNIGHDSWTQTQLDNAYNTADGLGFKLLISFDIWPWTVNDVAQLINRYKDRSSQFKVENRPFVSTFEGVDFKDNWADVRNSVSGDIFLVPAWTSLGPRDFSQQVSKVDGAFAWDAWSKDTSQKTTDSDKAWRDVLEGKPYMMAVSPWFYTNLPSKNWLWKGDSLWYTRWEEVLSFNPEYVEIITWNDYGESHYIGPINQPGIVSGAGRYVNGMPHDGWRFILPYYISAYKAGTRNVPITQEGFTFWYRLTPKDISGCGTGGTTCSTTNYGQVFQPDQCIDDSIYVVSLSNSDAQIEISIGGQVAGKGNVSKGASLFSASFGGKVGAVTVKLIKDGTVFAQGTGQQISNSCPDGGINYNAWVGVSNHINKMQARW